MISVVLATFNEEKNLKRCLDSVRDWANEVIVVDGSSTDKTVLIARESEAKIISTSNKPIFHINKQMAMDAATGDLVLQIDADEVVDDELASFIIKMNKKLLKNRDDKKLPVAWWIKRKNLFLGRFLKKGGQYPDPVIRLYINGYAKLPQKDVHEQMEVDGEVDWAEGHLLHYSNPTFADYMRKFQTYTTLTASFLFEKRVPISIWSAFRFFLFKPTYVFLLIFIRHKGFMDGWAGFIFALMSSLHHPASFIKLWGLYEK